jgi:lysyl-tRNA synthetase class II
MIASLCKRQYVTFISSNRRHLFSKHFATQGSRQFQAIKNRDQSPKPVIEKPERQKPHFENEKYMKLRFENLRQQNKALYPHKFEASMTVESFVKKFDHLKPSEIVKDEIVRVTGRIFSVRIAGRKLRFLDLHQNEARVQIKADVKEYNQEFEKFEKDFDVVRRGDIVGVSGFPCRTKAGELSIVPTIDGFQILAPSLRILPGVNFTNILRNAFAFVFESVFHSFSVLTVNLVS